MEVMFPNERNQSGKKPVKNANSQAHPDSLKQTLGGEAQQSGLTGPPGDSDAYLSLRITK